MIITHNGFPFDMLVLRKHGLLDKSAVDRAEDTIYACHALHPERPKRLEYQGALLTPFAYWKDEGKSGEEGEAVPDHQMDKYCGRDTQAQGLVHRHYKAEREAGGAAEARIYRHMLALGRLGHRMTWAGIRVDHQRRMEWAEKLRLRQWEHGKAINEVGEQHGIKLFASKGEDAITFSPVALRELFFKRFKLPVLERSATGLPKLDKATLRSLRELTTSYEVKSLIDHCMAYGAAIKLNSNYAEGLPVLGDGRIHPIWKAALAETLRWKSAKPNGQNIPVPMRDMFLPDEGCVWVEADGKQIEFRMVAEITQCKFIKDAFAQGDPYRPIILRLFECTDAEYSALPKSRQKAMRVIGKKFIHGSDYGGGAKTLHKQMTQATDDEGKLVAPNLKLDDVERMVAIWRKATPEIDRYVKFQQKVLNTLGYIPSTVMGVKRRYPGGAKYTEIANDPYQRTTGELLNVNTLELDKHLTRDHLGSIRMQVHDSVVVNVPKAKAEKAAKVVQEHLEAPIDINGRSTSFPFEVEIKDRWTEPD